MTEPKYVLRYFFEYGGGCLWGGSDAVYRDFDVSGRLAARSPANWRCRKRHLMNVVDSASGTTRRSIGTTRLVRALGASKNSTDSTPPRKNFYQRFVKSLGRILWSWTDNRQTRRLDPAHFSECLRTDQTRSQSAS